MTPEPPSTDPIRSIAACCAEPPPPALIAGIAQFNRREFYACHETLEEIWLADRGPIRRLYQAILQIGVAFYHLERGNRHGATSLLASGLTYLASFPPVCQGVDVAALLAAAQTAQTALEDLPPDRTGDFDPDLIPTVRILLGAADEPSASGPESLPPMPVSES